MSNPGSDKKNLREQALAALRSLSVSQREKLNARILARVLAWSEWPKVHTLFAYYSDADEPDTHGLITECLKASKRVGLPRVEKKTKRMRVHVVSDLKNDLKPGYAGLLEPKTELPELNPDELDAVLLPGRLFDAAGNRLGRGAGHYDRWCATAAHKPDLRRIAIAYECQIAMQLPAEAHDIPVQWIFTEDRTIEVRA